MATKTLNTRIKNRFDSLTNWSKTGVELLPGEIALVSVTTQQIDETTGNVVNVPAVLMKVGESDGNGGTKAFSALPWLSAKASDVYGWAKNQFAKDVPVTVADGTTYTTGTLGKYLYDHGKSIAANAQDISDLKVSVDVTKVSTAISDAISAAVNALDHTGNPTADKHEIVKAVTQTDGKVTVTYGEITKEELPKLYASDIIVSDAVGTPETEGYQPAVTVADKFGLVDQEIDSLKSSVSGGVHFIGVTTSEISDDATVNPVIVDGKGHNASAGDVVLKDEKEYIWDGSKWNELGDLTRVGTLESWRDGLDAEFTKVDHQFAVGIKQVDGIITEFVTARPTAVDVQRGTSNVDTDLGAAEQAISNIEADYMRIGTDNKMYAGKSGADMIIFDCGGAEI